MINDREEWDRQQKARKDREIWDINHSFKIAQFGFDDQTRYICYYGDEKEAEKTFYKLVGKRHINTCDSRVCLIHDFSPTAKRVLYDMLQREFDRPAYIKRMKEQQKGK